MKWDSSKSVFLSSWSTWLEHQSKACVSRPSSDRKFIKHGLKCSLDYGAPGLDPKRSQRPGLGSVLQEAEGRGLGKSYNMFTILLGQRVCLARWTHHRRWQGGIVFLWALGLQFLSSSSQNFCGSVLLLIQEATETQDRTPLIRDFKG